MKGRQDKNNFLEMQADRLHKEIMELKAAGQLMVERADKLLQMISAKPKRTTLSSKTVAAALAKRKTKLIKS